MRDALILFGPSAGQSFNNGEVDTSIFPPSSRPNGDSTRASTQPDTSIGMTADSVEGKQRLAAEGERMQSVAETTNEYSRFKFQRVQARRYTMLSMMNDEALPLKGKVVSMVFGQEMRSQDRNQLVQRLVTLISRLEFRHKERHNITESAAAKHARSARKRRLCQALTKIVNIWSLENESAVRIEYEIWDKQLCLFEYKWISWYPEDQGREYLGSIVSTSELTSIACVP
jgi:hypothetical protein